MSIGCERGGLCCKPSPTPSAAGSGSSKAGRFVAVAIAEAFEGEAEPVWLTAYRGYSVHVYAGSLL